MISNDYIAVVLLGLVPDALLAWVYMNLSSGGKQEFYLALTILICLHFFVAMKKTIGSWLVFRLIVRRRIAELILSHLKEFEYPTPENEIAPDYFSGVAQDEELSPNLRVIAAKESGLLNGYAANGVIYRFMIYAAYEDALEKYKQYRMQQPAFKR